MQRERNPAALLSVTGGMNQPLKVQIEAARTLKG
jgi:hypothetical protein